jgi:hypothetical protein
MNPRLLADENTSHHFVAACRRLDGKFPIVHIADWLDGACLSSKDPALLMTLREAGMVLVGFDRASMAKHAGDLTREALGHAGVILFRRSVSLMAYGKQATLLVNLWHDARDWHWEDRIVYLPLESGIGR